MQSSFIFLLLLFAYSIADQCTVIDEAFRRVASENATDACQCFGEGFDRTTDGVTIGCSGHPLPIIFNVLKELNDTMVAKIRIWDCLINIVPNDLLVKLQARPKSFTLERSEVAIIRPAAFSNVGSRLKYLSLRNNVIPYVNEGILEGLNRLQVLDMSGNKITTLKAIDFADVPDLRELILNDNDINYIEDNAFANLTKLKTLSLMGNQISNITKYTFKGLEGLEILHLQNNKITNIDWSAFEGMKKLRHLELGINHITQVELRGLDQLQKLFLNNNAIKSMKNISLRDLPSLIMLSLDRNMISSIDDGDLFGLSRSTRLESFTIAANNISVIGARALSPIQHISILALQNNQIYSLTTDGEPFLRPLRRLNTLLLSGNQLHAIFEQEIPKTVTVLAADHNQLEKIDGNAFEGVSLHKLFINNNHLTYLPRNTFDSFTYDSIEAIDVTANAWQCVCGEEWLGEWIEKAGVKDVGYGALGCLAAAARHCGQNTDTSTKVEVEEGESKSIWITVVAAVLAAVSLLILAAIVFLCVVDHKQPIVLANRLHRRVDSDLHKLIQDHDNLLRAEFPFELPKPRASVGDKKRVRFEDN